MARGSRQSEGRSARSEGLPARNEVVMNWMRSGTTVLEDREVEALDKKQETMMANIVDAQKVLAKQDQADLVRALGGEEKAAKIIKDLDDAGLSRDLLKPRGVINRQERFNKELKEAGDAPLAKDDPILVNAIQNYYSAQVIGSAGQAHIPTYERAGQGGNGYAKSSFQPVYNKDLGAWEMVRYGNPLLNSDDPNDFVTEKGWYAVKGSPNDKTLETKMKKVAIVMNTFIED